MKVWGLPRNPAAEVERPRYRVSDDPRRVLAGRCPTPWSGPPGSEQDACSVPGPPRSPGLRLGELLCAAMARRRLHRRHAPGATELQRTGGLGTPKSGKVRSVPLVADVAETLAGLGLGGRARFTGDEDLVFAGGGRLGSWTPVRFVTATRPLLGRAGPTAAAAWTTFGTRSGPWPSRRAEVPAVQAWMGHSDIQTTMRYVHHRDRGGEARGCWLEAFRVANPSVSELKVERGG